MWRYTKYYIWCHLLFYVNVVPCLMTLLMSEFTELRFGWNSCQLVKQSLVYFAFSQSCNETLPWTIENELKNHIVSNSNCNGILGLQRPNVLEGMTNNVSLHIVWVTLTRVVYNQCWARQIRLVTINTIFSVAPPQ